MVNFFHRYQDNRAVLKEGMTRLGFQEFLDSSHKGYIITSYKFPSHKNFDFQQFYTKLNERGMLPTSFPSNLTSDQKS